MIPPKQSATQLRRNMMQAKGSPDKHMHMDPAQLRLIPGQRRAQSARQELTKQKLDTSTVPESLGELIGWCVAQDFYAALRKHNDPNDDYRLPLFPHLSLVATSNRTSGYPHQFVCAMVSDECHLRTRNWMGSAAEWGCNDWILSRCRGYDQARLLLNGQRKPSRMLVLHSTSNGGRAHVHSNISRNGASCPRPLLSQFG